MFLALKNIRFHKNKVSETFECKIKDSSENLFLKMFCQDQKSECASILIWPFLTSMDQSQTPSLYPQDTFHSPSRHLPDPFQAPSRHSPDTRKKPTKFQILQLGWEVCGCFHLLARFQVELKLPSGTK